MFNATRKTNYSYDSRTSRVSKVEVKFQKLKCTQPVQLHRHHGRISHQLISLCREVHRQGANRPNPNIPTVAGAFLSRLRLQFCGLVYFASIDCWFKALRVYRHCVVGCSSSTSNCACTGTGAVMREQARMYSTYGNYASSNGRIHSYQNDLALRRLVASSGRSLDMSTSTTYHASLVAAQARRACRHSHLEPVLYKFHRW